MDELKKEHKEQFEKERDFHDKTLKEYKTEKMICKSLQESNTLYHEKNIILEERNNLMLTQLKEYYYIHFKHTGLGCHNCKINMLEVEKLKKKFPEIEDQKTLKTQFQKMEDRNKQIKEDLRSAESALKTRE